MAHVLVLGASGMAGHVVTTHLRDRGHSVTGVAGHHSLDADTLMFDVFDEPRLGSFLRAQKSDAIVNCIGALVSASSSRPASAVYLNSYLPLRLADLFADSATRIIHLSTDCVFSGDRGGYSESAVPDARDIYGRSKALGEIDNDKDVTLRMSIIGPEIRPDGSGLMRWLLESTGQIEGYTGSKWNGITTLQLAIEIERLVTSPTWPCGIVHPVAAQGLSKFEILELLADTFNHLEVQIHPVTGKEADKTLISTRDDFKPDIPDYPRMLRELRAWILAHRHLYEGQRWIERIT